MIELLVVIASIAILVVLILVALGVARPKARDSQRKTDIRAIQTALELYSNDKQAYPQPTGNAGKTWDEALVEAKYLDSVPKDPSSSKVYGYAADSAGTNYVLCAQLESPASVYFAGTAASDTTLKDSCTSVLNQ